jgi:hypothetical protein
VLAEAIVEPEWRASIHVPSEVHLAADMLVRNLAKLGYTGAENRSIRVTNNQNRELYRLLFASKAPLADKIWQSMVKNPTSGQRSWGF